MGAIQSTVRKLDKTTYCIDQFDVHLYLFLGKERALLLDTGFSDADDLMAAIAGITSLPLVVANSHGHPDHSGGNHKFGQVYAHPDGFARVREYQQGECKLLPLNEGDTLDLGGRVFEAVSIPGHQEGAIALLQSVFAAGADFDGPMPGKSAAECGNYRNLSLEAARAQCAFYRDLIQDWTAEKLAY